MRSTPFLRSSLLALALAGCGAEEAPTAASYSIPSSLDELSGETFFDHPWPSDLRTVNGAPRLQGFLNPKNVPILAQYISALDGKLDGFSPVAAGYVRFTGPVDVETLPADPAATLEPRSTVQLIDIDPASPEHGQRKLVSLFFRQEPGVYWVSNLLAFQPTPGFPLRPGTRYAFVVTDGVRGADGTPVQRSADLDELLGFTPPTERTAAARQVFASAVTEVEKAGVDRASIVQFTSFRTADPVSELFLVADDVPKSVPAPKVDPSSWKLVFELPTYDLYHGEYGPSPNYQAGKLPFAYYGDGGQFNIVDGKPQVVDTFSLRFSLSVPKEGKCPPPPDGYPVALYAHGTGGDFESYVRDGTARELAQRCIATMGVDQIFHGMRPGAPGPDASEQSVQILFFNFENPVAARTNPRQGAVDEVQRARLFTESKISVPASISNTGAEIRFDPAKVLYFGHSQGGLSGPLFLASSSATRGAVLSGAGAIFGIALLEKTEPQPSIKQLVTNIFLNLTADEAPELNLFHPAISLAQAMVDVTDTVNYARYLTSEPRPGFPAKSIYMTEGVNPDGVGDSYAPPLGIEAHGIAVGLPLQLPGQRAIAQTAWGGPQPIAVPAEGLSGNLAGGAASGVFAQWPISAGDDGHYVIFDDPRAADQAADFLRNLADDPKGRVPAPK